MVTLQNIRKINTIVRANYYIESDSDDVGYVEYDTHSKRVVKHEYSERDKEFVNRPGISKAVRAIENLAKNNIFPKQYKYMWY